MRKQVLSLGAMAVTVLCVLQLISTLPVQAQTESVLYGFCPDGFPNCVDGSYPTSSLTADGSGNLYGTTISGGSFGQGTVFELSPIGGGGGWSETVLYSFCSNGVFPYCTDGANPTYSSVIFDKDGNLYGTAANGGAYRYGVVWKLSHAGATWTETVLYSFCEEGYPCSVTGINPLNGLIVDSAGNFYGTAVNAAAGSPGTIFELSPSGGGWTEQVLYTYEPSGGGLTIDATGNIFSTGNDSVFELSPNGSGGWNQTSIYTFIDKRGGPYPPSGTLVLDKTGSIYGITPLGGAKDYGTVFKLSRKKNGKWIAKVLHGFENGPVDGSFPNGIVLDTSGNIFGTTRYGGNGNGNGKCRRRMFCDPGTVFELVPPPGKGKYTEKILLSFNGTDGANPYATVTLDSAGNLYGTTWYGGMGYDGGTTGYGVVFEVTP
jgi:uncharacterized repeat protein (TIGR03803 family)